MAGLLKTLWNLDETVALLRVKFSLTFTSKKPDLKNLSPSLRECYQLLDKTGRSFGFLINLLEEELRNALCVFYLVLRAADTIEDDMSLPSHTKVAMLKSFDQVLLDRTWKYTDSQDEHAVVLDNFPSISQGLHELPTKYRDIILEMGSQVSQGMATFVGKEIISMEDLNQYSYYAVALFCIGIMRVLDASGFGDKITAEDTATIVQCGILLHKTNVIKDFWRDWNSGRLYWPKDIWSKYVDSPGEFLRPENQQVALECLNEFIGDTLEQVPRDLTNFKKLINPDFRGFLAANGLIAIATLERCYNNPDVFRQTVKIRRGQTAKIVLSATSIEKAHDIFQDYILKIMKRANRENSQDTRTRQVCLKILDKAKEDKMNNIKLFRLSSFVYILCLSSAAAAAAMSFLWW